MKIVNDDGTPVSIGAALGHWLQAAVTLCVSFFLRTILYVGACASIAVLVLMLCRSFPLPGPWPAPAPAPPPAPTDPLTKTFQVAYDADADPQKAAHVKQLAAVWTAAGTQVNQPTVMTTGQMLTALKATADGEIGAAALPSVRKAVAAEVDAAVGTKDVPIDDTLRAKMAAEFSKVGAALGGVK